MTILNWSFPRKDLSRSAQAYQLALALREEVDDLQKAGCRVIQVRQHPSSRPCPPTVLPAQHNDKGPKRILLSLAFTARQYTCRKIGGTLRVDPPELLRQVVPLEPALAQDEQRPWRHYKAPQH